MICLRGNKLVGMAAIRGIRPFSLDQKLNNLDSYLPENHSPCEIRLLAIEKSHRGSRIIKGLMILLIQYYERHKHDLVLISAVIRQLKLYKHMGFIPFGPTVGTNKASFQPMYLTSAAVEKLKLKLRISWFSPIVVTPAAKPQINLLPGPVSIREEVRQVFSESPVSHRSAHFVEDFQEVKRLLCQLVDTDKVEILMGSGTLANDTIAAQLSLIQKRGLILSNGEFGERLIDHAARFRLSFATFKTDWGNILHKKAVENAIKQNYKIDWLWVVHCESSTGVLNDVTMLKDICAKWGIRLCLDCISSIGIVPLDLHDVYLASAVSGKGLGSLPGLSMVFYNHDILPAKNILPRYLDLGLYATQKGIPFTISSNQIYALKKVLEYYKSANPYDEISSLYSWVRYRLERLGLAIITPDTDNSPAIITIALDNKLNSDRIGQQLEDAGYLLSYRSEYLLRRNWIQICIMGEYSRNKITPLFSLLRKITSSSGDRFNLMRQLGSPPPTEEIGK